MKLTCTKSGVRFTCDVGFGSGKVLHPIFQFGLADLLKSHLPAFTTGNLAPDEIHLFGAALLAKLPVDRWDCPLVDAETLQPIWLSTIKRMSYMVDRLDARKTDALPHYRVTKQTADLANLVSYLDALQAAVTDLAFSPIQRDQRDGHKRITEEIFKITRDAEQKLYNRNSYKLPAHLAQWAAVAGEFPVDLVTVSDGNGWTKKLPLREHWKAMIIRACSANSIKELLSASTTVGDYRELIEHCEQRIPYGSMHTDLVLNHLRNALDILTEFRPAVVKPNLDALLAELVSGNKSADKDKDTTTTLQTGEDYVMPEPPKPAKSAPPRNEFPSMAAWMKAKINWQNAVTQYANWVKLQQVGVSAGAGSKEKL